MILVTGSLAYDYLMKFSGHFNDHLDQKNKNISVSFFAISNEKHFGGTAGNIAYSLSLLGVKPEIVSTAGNDFGDYIKHFEQCGIPAKNIKIVNEDITASAYVLTDLNNNQITTFYGGAMLRAEEKWPSSFHPDLVIIAPTQLEKMVYHVKKCQKEKISYIFDPGQSLPLWGKEGLLDAITKSKITIVNEFELSMIVKTLKMKNEEVLKLCSNFIVTLGEKGSFLIEKGKKTLIKVAQCGEVVDPTGCGDALRSGLLYGLEKGYSLEKACKFGSLVASYVISNKATQKHKFKMTELKKRFLDEFGENL